MRFRIPLPLLVVAWGCHAFAQTPSLAGVRVATEIADSGLVKFDEQGSVHLPDGILSYQRTYQLIRRDQNGHSWRVAYTFKSLTIDGAPSPLEPQEADGRVVVNLKRGNAPAASFAYSLSYQVENALERHDGIDQLQLAFGADAAIQDATITLSASPQIVSNAVLSAFTEATAASLSCQCVIQQNKSSWLIKTTSQPRGPMVIRISAPKGNFKPPLRTFIRLAEQDHPTWLPLFLFAVFFLPCSVSVGFFAIRWGGGGLQLRRRWTTASWVIGILSVAVATFTDQPYSAMPGMGAGLLLGFALGGAPAIVVKSLTVGVAVIVNRYFYKGIGHLIAGIGKAVAPKKSHSILGSVEN